MKLDSFAKQEHGGVELLDPQSPCFSELLVNGLPLKTRPYPIPGKEWNPQDRTVRVKGMA